MGAKTVGSAFLVAGLATVLAVIHWSLIAVVGGAK